VSADEAEDVEALLDRTAKALEASLTGSEGRPLAVRLLAEGTPREGSRLERDAHRLDEALRLYVASEHGARVFVERVKVRLTPPRDGDVLAFFAPRGDVEDERRALDADLAELEKKLPPEARAKIFEARDELLDDAMARAEAELLAATSTHDPGSEEGTDP
jgi:hypothetical protein